MKKLKQLYYHIRLWLLIEGGEHLAATILVVLAGLLIAGTILMAKAIAGGILK